MNTAVEGFSIRSQALWERAKESLAGGVSHDGRFLPPHPAYFERALGARKWDVDGREYLDYAMGSAAMMLGHSHPGVVAALVGHAGLGTFFATVHPLEIEWAELIKEMVPSAEKVRFVGSGTEATMLALRVARAYSQRPRVLRFEGHFHGWHDYVVQGMKAPYDRVPCLGIPEEVASTMVVCTQDCERVDALLAADSSIGTVIVEASGANWGSVPLSDVFLRDLRTVCDRRGCVLIFDEVISGFRWSPGGRQAVVGVTPDMTTMAKIVAGGMPGGAVAGKSEIMRFLDPSLEIGGHRPPIIHRGTFNASPIVAAAAVAALKVIRTGEPHRQADAIAASLRQGMQEVLDRLSVDALVYGESSTFHVYFGRGARRCDIATVPPDSIRSLKRSALDVYTCGLRARGVDFMSYTGGVTSLAHTDADVGPTLEAFQGAVEDLLAAQMVPRL